MNVKFSVMVPQVRIDAVPARLLGRLVAEHDHATKTINPTRYDSGRSYGYVLYTGTSPDSRYPTMLAALAQGEFDQWCKIVPGLVPA